MFSELANGLTLTVASVNCVTKPPLEDVFKDANTYLPVTSTELL